MLIYYLYLNACGFCDDVCDVVGLKIADGKLLEMKGRTNLGLESENVMLWVEKKSETLRVGRLSLNFVVNGG